MYIELVLFYSYTENVFKFLQKPLVLHSRVEIHYANEVYICVFKIRIVLILILNYVDFVLKGFQNAQTKKHRRIGKKSWWQHPKYGVVHVVD